MKKMILNIMVLMMVLGVLTGCGKKEVEVACTMCNGSGEVKYYYGEGDDDYNMGPCTSCDEKGYITVVPEGDSDQGNKEICGSCETYVDELITKEDAAGESRTWCADCWASYEDIMGL